MALNINGANKMITWNSKETQDAFFHLTTKRKDRTREYIDAGVALVLRGGVRKTAEIKWDGSQVVENREGVADVSETMLGVTSMRLSRSFGVEGNSRFENRIGRQMSLDETMRVDFDQLADQLLRKYVPEYVPCESADTIPVVQNDDEGE